MEVLKGGASRCKYLLEDNFNNSTFRLISLVFTLLTFKYIHSVILWLPYDCTLVFVTSQTAHLADLKYVNALNSYTMSYFGGNI